MHAYAAVQAPRQLSGPVFMQLAMQAHVFSVHPSEAHVQLAAHAFAWPHGPVASCVAPISPAHAPCSAWKMHDWQLCSLRDALNTAKKPRHTSPQPSGGASLAASDPDPPPEAPAAPEPPATPPSSSSASSGTVRPPQATTDAIEPSTNATTIERLTPRSMAAGAPFRHSIRETG